MPTPEENLRNAIDKVLAREETAQGHSLALEERACFIQGWAELVNLAASKFVTGAIEHADEPWRNVNFRRERRNEVIDLCHYDMGERFFNNGK